MHSEPRCGGVPNGRALHARKCRRPRGQFSASTLGFQSRASRCASATWAGVMSVSTKSRLLTALGWHALDLFGCHPTAPLARLDCMGLALILHGRDVIGLDAGAARIATKSGSLIFRRRERHPPETLAVWEIERPVS